MLSALIKAAPADAPMGLKKDFVLTLHDGESSFGGFNLGLEDLRQLRDLFDEAYENERDHRRFGEGPSSFEYRAEGTAVRKKLRR